MNPQEEFESLKQELFSLGFNQPKFDELLELAAQEAVAIALEDLELIEDEQKLEELSTLMNTPVNDKSEAEERINKLFITAYGQEAESKKLALVINYLKETVEITKSSKDLMARYEAGDPTAIASVQSNIDEQEVQAVQDLVNSKE